MFHRIKSEPQQAVQKEETPLEEAIASSQESEYTEGSNENEPSAIQEEQESVQEYAQPQNSMDEQSEEVEEMSNEEQQETASEATEDEAQNESQEEENHIMTNENETVETMEQEETAYRAPSSVTGGYQSSYAGSAYTAPTAPAEAATQDAGYETEADRRLVIVQGITMSGEIESCPHLVVEGTVEASLRGAEVLEVAQTGIFYGTVEIAEATISGRFEGDITVTGRLTITETGQITGSITYGELEMEAGAMIDGKLTPIASAAKASRPAPKAKKKAAAPQNVPASNDAGLFSEEGVVAAE